MPKADKSTAVPQLRFPEFRERGEWTAAALHELAAFVTDRVGTTECVPYTVTSGVGLVGQQAKLGRTIAGNSIKNYVLLQRDDFAFNKSATKAFPQGYIARFVGDERAAVPNSVFTSFRVDHHTIVPAYLDYLFSSNLHGKWLRNFLTIGARAHGSLNVNDDDLMALPVPLPGGSTALKEQQKIVDCLASLDEAITAQRRKVETLKTHKRGLMQRLFPHEGETLPRLRFPGFRGDNRFEFKPIGKFAKVTTGDKDTQNRIDDGTYPFFVRSQQVERIDSFSYDGEAVLTSGDGVGVGENYHYINGRFAFHQRVYCIYCFDEDVSGQFFFYFFSSRFGKRVKQMSAKNSVDSVRMAMVTEMEIWLPAIEEQQQIAGCLSTLDARIVAEVGKLDALKTHRRALMQQLFPSPEEG